MDSRNIVPVRILFEARHEPNIEAVNHFGTFQQHYKTHYRIKEYEAGSRVALKNNDENLHIFWSVTNFGLEHTGSVDRYKFITEALSFIEYVANNIQLQELNRIGVRMDLVVPVKEKEHETLNFLYKLFGKSALGQLGKAVGDLNLTIGSMEEHYQQLLNFQFGERQDNSEIYRNTPKKGLIIDVDSFKEGTIQIDEITEFLPLAVDVSIKKVQNFLTNFLVRGEK